MEKNGAKNGDVNIRHEKVSYLSSFLGWGQSSSSMGRESSVGVEVGGWVRGRIFIKWDRTDVQRKKKQGNIRQGSGWSKRWGGVKKEDNVQSIIFSDT